MTQAELKVSIQSDISQLERDLTTAEKLLVQHQQNYDSVSRSITQTASRMREVGREAQNLRSAFNSGKISADRFEKEMGQLNKEVRQLDNEMADLTREQTRLGREMQRTTRVVQQQRGGFAGVADGTQQASQGMRQMARTATVNAVPAMTSVSQIVQDMPYGIQGVANNIQQLTMQMGWLTTQAGGTRKALTALAGSLWGPAGLLLAVSLVTSLMVSAEGQARSYGQILLNLTQRVNGLKKEFLELAKANRESIAQIQAEVTQAQALMGVIDDENESRDKRLEAIKGVNKIMPQALENYSEEAILAGEAAEQIDKVSEALVRMARMQNIRSQLAGVYEEIAKIEETISSGRTLEGVDWWEGLLAQAKNSFSGLGGITNTLIELNEIGTENLNEDLDKANEKARALTQRLREVIDEALESGDFSTLYDEIRKEGKKERIPVDFVLGDGTISGPDLSQSEWAQQQIEQLEALREQYPRLSEEYRELTERINALKLAMGDLGWAGLIEAEGAMYKFADSSKIAEAEVSKSAARMRRALEMAIQGMIKSMLDGKFEAEDFAKSIIASFLSIGVNNLIGGLPFLSGIFGGGAQAANFRMPSINTAQTASNLNSGAQLSVGVPDIRIQGQDLLVVFDRANQRKNRIT